MLAQPPGVGIADMIDPPLDAGVELGEADAAGRQASNRSLSRRVAPTPLRAFTRR